MNVHRPGSWRLKPFEDCPAMHTDNPPNRFWRFMQWLCFGFRWERE